MALLGSYHVGTGTAVQLSTLIPSTVKEINILSNPASAALFYIGPSTVTAAGVNAWIALDAGQSFGLKAMSGDQLALALENVYVIGTASDKLHISYIT
jgi:hypothetical protein